MLEKQKDILFIYFLFTVNYATSVIGAPNFIHIYIVLKLEHSDLISFEDDTIFKS
jgi:hypothetical protein